MMQRKNKEQQRQAEYQLKISLLGDGAVGKTCLLIRWFTGEFPDEYIPTVFDYQIDTFQSEDGTFKILYADTASREYYDRLLPVHLAHSDLFLVCFSVVSPRSTFQGISALQEVQDHWVGHYIARYGGGAPFLLVGTKIDLRDDPDTLERLKSKNMKPITHEEGLAFAQRIGATGYFEVSSLKGIGLSELFTVAVKVAQGKYDKRLKKRLTKCTLM